jgi:KDO2-lipid IV(A) lauroyltransferase
LETKKVNLDERTEGRAPAAGAALPALEAGAALAPAEEARARPLPQGPSLFYGALIWRLGLGLARVLPSGLLKGLAGAVAVTYFRIFPRRREVVVRNLLPLMGGDAGTAAQTGRRLFRTFAGKLVDLWRFEAGLPVTDAFGELTGWEHFLAAQKSGRGVLLVTPHLGNWEFGAPLLTDHGYKLHVITLVEPGVGLTELRQAARAKQGIETTVIGRDPFAFVEIIRRLEAGATVALLMDRPPKASAVDVKLCGKPFAASIAAAELARATNCLLLPVYLPLVNGRYEAHILPPVDYERASLRDPAARQRLTQELVAALEPAIRRYPEQWYHFVPVWK